jgi:hypothetical protein
MYKFFEKIKNKITYFLYKLIENIENYELRNNDLDQNDISKKILYSIKTNNLKVKTDTGYQPVSEIHSTQPFDVYRIDLDNYHLECADNHIVFDKYFNEVFVKDLKKGDYIITETGIQKINSISKKGYTLSMFDLTVDHPNHRFYTNGILSHNTISASIFMLHTILFSNDKNIMIVANKGDTAVEIVDKIKSIYSLLPFFLKPGIKTWNQKSLTFENGCRIKTSARSKTPAIGFTIDVLYLDEFAHIPSNIIEPYYTAAYPTVSAVQNSKIIITSTPNGMNLFHKLLTDAERPDGDPLKNNYKAMRVYWHQVPGRFVTYLRLNNHRLYEHGVTKEQIFSSIRETYPENITKTHMGFNSDFQKDIISVFNNERCTDEDVKNLTFIDSKGFEVPLRAIGEMTTWKEEAVKDIGGEDAFNQEYGLRFINSSKSLLNEAIIDSLLNNKKNYKFEEIFEFENKLRFSYKDLKWIDDDEIFLPINRKTEKVIISVDISEGLGQDYSIMNIFKISKKDMDLIESQKASYKSVTDFIRLEQFGLFRSNLISVKQLAELLYILAFEYFNPDNVKIVLELNNYGNTLLAELPHVFDGNNQYGSSIFFRYKHRADATEEKVGLKVGENKNMMVKDYQDLMISKGFSINNEETVREITTFVKHTTTAGNTRYAADVGHDDCVMTIVNTTSIFSKNDFKEMVEDTLQKDTIFKNYVEECLNNLEYTETVDYSQLLSVRRKVLNRNKTVNDVNSTGINWFNSNGK